MVLGEDLLKIKTSRSTRSDGVCGIPLAITEPTAWRRAARRSECPPDGCGPKVNQAFGEMAVSLQFGRCGPP